MLRQSGKQLSLSAGGRVEARHTASSAATLLLGAATASSVAASPGAAVTQAADRGAPPNHGSSDNPRAAAEFLPAADNNDAGLQMPGKIRRRAILVQSSWFRRVAGQVFILQDRIQNSSQQLMILDT